MAPPLSNACPNLLSNSVARSLSLLLIYILYAAAGTLASSRGSGGSGGGSIYRSRLPRSEGLEPLASRTFFEENRSSNFLSESKKILQCMWSGASDCASPLLRCVRVCAVVGDCVPQPPRRWELGNICEAPPISGGVSSEGCRVRTELERFTRFATLRHSAAASTRRGVVCLSNEAPLSYGCVSVCESNFCNKRSSSKALLRLQFMQLDEWFGSITSAAFAPMYLAKPAK